ncbi:MAG: hypothetical protein V2B13_07410 [Pseudomonadota bacterium]
MKKKSSDLRIKFYAKWKEFIEKQAVDPDQPRNIKRFEYPILVPAGKCWDGYPVAQTE